MLRAMKLLGVLVLLLVLQGCVLTKLVTVPMRVVGGVISIIPGVGNTVHDSIDTAADVVDDVPL